ncbi:hypothetical protein DPMN_030703 [Dreissena polymorpha]|uniref:HAT C-terminal dimerisation domain-containing protein n=1 Tax=Dreissena polymorpha TaxID=45954 RepID=A0A9D4RGE4_DREPO|nr:hypothetical protein DPMN_030703 [Dreissena polymorpha]
MQYLLPDRVQDLYNDQQTKAIYSAAQADLEVNMEAFHREWQRWKFRCEQTQIPSTLSLETMLLALPEDLCPNVARCFHPLLVMPVSTASAERSFSTMRRPKTYLR